MENKIRKQTYSLEQYLKLMKDESIRSDPDCQRLSGQWNPNMVNELIATVLTGDYIPPVILGEETINGIVKKWIIDGLQRSSTLFMFRYGNTKITNNIDEFMIGYQRRVIDENGNVQRDEDGEIIWETVECDIRGRSYDMLPEELKDRFKEYQLECAIHQNCDMTQIAKLVRRYNNHRAMNQAQRAFTYIDVFAREIRDITASRFFQTVYSLRGKDRINGTLERIVGNMVILCYYPNKYRKDTKEAFKWLNENGTMADFANMEKLLDRLTDCLEVTPEIRNLFVQKNAHIFVTAFKEFTELGRTDNSFNDFLHWFTAEGMEMEIDGHTWETIEDNGGTMDVGMVRRKINYILESAKLFVETQPEVA